jgi:Holliday junction resolvase RusA-like endonuclease
VIKVIDIDNIKLGRVNQKFGKNWKTNKLYLLDEYRKFKDLIQLITRKVKIDPPYAVKIEVETYADIDSFIKPLLDGIQTAGTITTDKEVRHLVVLKTPGKKGRPSSLKVYVGSLAENIEKEVCV